MFVSILSLYDVVCVPLSNWKSRYCESYSFFYIVCFIVENVIYFHSRKSYPTQRNANALWPLFQYWSTFRSTRQNLQLRIRKWQMSKPVSVYDTATLEHRVCCSKLLFQKMKKGLCKFRFRTLTKWVTVPWAMLFCISFGDTTYHEKRQNNKKPISHPL